MKRMIISPAQLKMINEAAVPYIAGGQYGPGTGNETAEEALQKAFQNNPNIPDNQSIYVQNSDQTASDPVAAYVPGVGNGTNANNNVGANNQGVTATKSSLTSESRFSKRQIELGRMLEMRRTGKVFSKKQLNEMFMETQENAKRLRDGIGNCDIFQVIDAVDEFFPEESENFKEALHNGADLTEYICSIFSNGKVNADKEEEFLESLGL